MWGRNIIEGVVILHDVVHELHRKKNKSGIIFKIDFEKAYKIDFEKAYNKVKWFLLFQALRTKGFSPKWIKLADSFISGVV